MANTSQIEIAYNVTTSLLEDESIIRINGTSYQYEEGVYIEVNDNIIANKLRHLFLQEGLFIKKSIIDECLLLLQNKTYKQFEEQIKALITTKNNYEINTKSGILDLKTLTVTKYNREELRFNKINFDYKEKYNCPMFINFLKSTFEFDLFNDEKAETYQEIHDFIQEWMGYSLVKGNKMQKALILVGEGRNGKGVLIDIWSQVVGMHNVSNVDLAGLNNRQEISITLNKLINFSPDLTANLQLDTGVVKTITSCEPVVANPKWGKPFTFEFTAKIIIACNELPYIKEVGHAIRERFFVLPFKKSFLGEKADHQLKIKLKKELPAIFAWAVEGLKRLEKNKKFSVPNICKNEAQNYEYENDSIKQWLEECDEIELIHNAESRASDLYKSYASFCREHGKRPISNQKMYKKLEVKKYFRKRSMKGFVFRGIMLEDLGMFVNSSYTQ